MTDAIPVNDLVIHAGPDFRAWPATKAITEIQLKDDGSSGAFGVRRVLAPYVPLRDKDAWPDFVPPGWDGPLRDTLCLIVRGDGRWQCAPVIEFWHDRDWTGAALLRHYKEWAYHWDSTLQWAPKRGDTIGFVVTSGQTRMDKAVYGVRDGQAVKERSNIVTVQLVENAVYTFTADVPPPPPPPDPVPDGDIVLTDNTAVLESVADLSVKVDALQRSMLTLAAAMNAIASVKAPRYRGSLAGRVPIDLSPVEE